MQGFWTAFWGLLGTLVIAMVLQIGAFLYMWGGLTTTVNQNTKHLWNSITPAVAENTRNIDRLITKWDTIQFIVGKTGETGKQGIQGIQGLKGEDCK